MTHEEILAKTKKVVYDCMPELAGVEITENSVINTDMGMDSMNFILIICKLEALFDIRIPERKWKKLQTFGEVVETIESYLK